MWLDFPLESTMFGTLLRKEILEYLVSIRFVVLTALCVLLIPLSLYVNFETYRLWTADYNEQLKIESALGRGGGRPGYEGVRPPSLLSVFANGIETSLPKDFSLDNNWGFAGNLPGIKTPKSTELPRFNVSFPRIVDTLVNSLPDIGLLLIYAVLLFAGATLAFLRYDVR